MPRGAPACDDECRPTVPTRPSRPESSLLSPPPRSRRARAHARSLDDVFALGAPTAPPRSFFPPLCHWQRGVRAFDVPAPDGSNGRLRPFLLFSSLGAARMMFARRVRARVLFSCSSLSFLYLCTLLSLLSVFNLALSPRRRLDGCASRHHHGEMGPQRSAPCPRWLITAVIWATAARLLLARGTDRPPSASPDWSLKPAGGTSSHWKGRAVRA